MAAGESYSQMNMKTSTESYEDCFHLARLEVFSEHGCIQRAIKHVYIRETLFYPRLTNASTLKGLMCF